jgi:hypothetical protein
MNRIMSSTLQKNVPSPASDRDSPAPFLVTSCGQTGAIWLGQALNKHSEILCTSGTDHPLMAMNYEYNDDEIVKIRAGIKNAADLRLGVSPGLEAALKRGGFFKYGGAPVREDKYGGIFTPMDNLMARGHAYVPYLFDELDELPKLKPYKAYGNVRGMTAAQCVNEMQKGAAAFNGRGNAFPVADLIRDPIIRLDTVINFFQLMYERTPDFKQTVADEMASQSSLVSALEIEYDIDLSASLNRAFFYVEFLTRHSVTWANDIKAGPHIPRMPFEKLHSDREYFANFVHYLTGGRVVADEAYLDWIFDPGHIDNGRPSNPQGRKKRKTARETYESWPAWQQEQVRQTFQVFDIAKVYEPFGYDLSFLDSA